MQPTDTLTMSRLDGWGFDAAQRREDLFLRALGALLLGYALFGHGVAYLGVPPVFVGEVLLAVGVLLLLAGVGWGPLLDSVPGLLLVSFILWGAVCTIPYVPRYGVLALRDAVLWGYAVWAIVVGGLLVARPQRLRMLVEQYRRFVPIFLVGAPIVWAVETFLGHLIPNVPGTRASLIAVKPGDVLVHSAGILAFVAMDLARNTNVLGALLLSLNVVIAGRSNRGGLLAFFAVFALVNVFRPLHRWSMTMVGWLAVMLIVFVVADVSISTGQRRKISVTQLVNNIVSVFGHSPQANLENTKQWRLNWWRDIAGYTFAGRHFWTGKGYGVNLADDDGYQVRKDGTLRSPHSAHLNILARSGVPGFALWVLLQLAFLASVIEALVHARRAGRRTWSSLLVFLLAYWLALMVNATFDVFLEGPMGGVWFWSVFGVGLAAAWIYHRHPEVLDDLESQEAGDRA
jgi:hypothetical protein